PRTAGIANGHAWCCFRPTTADEQPVIDRVPGIENAWVTCGHFRTGILMAAATGDVLARWIRTGDRPAGAAPGGIHRVGGRGAGGGVVRHRSVRRLTGRRGRSHVDLARPIVFTYRQLVCDPEVFP